MPDSVKYIQKIIFGSPGTGKSYCIRGIAEEKLGIKSNADILPNSVKVVFHPEYTYSDFMGKLLPLSSGNSIIYKYYAGHFLQALGMAYKALIDGDKSSYLLVIDELNRGNASAIFGSVFQLLDREDSGWSTYEVDISEMELIGLFNAMGYKTELSNNNNNIIVDGSNIDNFFNSVAKQKESKADAEDCLKVLDLLSQRKIKIPHNLSIIATINTSDESIYYLDSAFKRRWDWEYVDAPSKQHIDDYEIPTNILKVKLVLPDDKTLSWYRCIVGVNEFIKLHHQIIRRIEDKQIGWWFIKPVDESYFSEDTDALSDTIETFVELYTITLEQVKDKLMFYLWDGVFARDKKTLTKYIEDKLGEKNVTLVTYADFLKFTSRLLVHWHDSTPDNDNF
jgi:5-methylcytosine-specific restriction enzyme B